MGRDLCRLSIRLSHRYRSPLPSFPLPSSPRSQWIKHSIGTGAPGRQWWYFWNSTVRLKYLTVYLPLPRFLLTRAHGRFAVSVLSFVKIIHEALLPFPVTNEEIDCIDFHHPSSSSSSFLAFLPFGHFSKKRIRLHRFHLDVPSTLGSGKRWDDVWDDANGLPSCGGKIG